MNIYDAFCLCLYIEKGKETKEKKKKMDLWTERREGEKENKKTTSKNNLISKNKNSNVGLNGYRRTLDSLFW